MIQFCLRVTTTPANRTDVVETFELVMGPTGDKRGCQSATLYQESSDPAALLYIEEWERQEDFEKHVRSDQFWMLIGAMEMSAGPPDIRLNIIAKQLGIEHIVAVRGEMTN